MANILLVDDTPAATEPLAKYLEDAGHDVTYLPNGKEALASVLAELPDVVVLDLLCRRWTGLRSWR